MKKEMERGEDVLNGETVVAHFAPTEITATEAEVARYAGGSRYRPDAKLGAEVADILSIVCLLKLRERSNQLMHVFLSIWCVRFSLPEPRKGFLLCSEKMQILLLGNPHKKRSNYPCNWVHSEKGDLSGFGVMAIDRMK